MTYTKMTPEGFVKKLEGGGYKSATAARRAVGKAAFPKAGKDDCYAAINKHFGEDAKPPKGKPPRASSGGKKSTAPASEEALGMIDLAHKRVGTISQALIALKAAKEASPEIDIKAGAEAASGALTDIMKGIHTSVLGKTDPKSNGVIKEEPAPDASPSP